jgi:hypothetical protein
MSFIQRISKTVATIADGSATDFTAAFTGKIVAVEYVKDTYDNGVDFTITVENSGENVWVESDVNASTVRRPRAATHSTAGVAALYAAAGTAVLEQIAVANSRLKIVLAQGGNVKSGTFHVVVE